MIRTLVLVLGLFAACGGKTGVFKNDYSGSLTLTLVNQTPRSIDAIYIYPVGTTNRGTSWTSLAPGATTTVKIKEGNFELVAVSAERRIDAKFRETPEATTSLELRNDQKLVFHDDGHNPPGVDAKGTLGVTFMIGQPDPAEPTTEPSTEAVVEPAPADAP